MLGGYIILWQEALVMHQGSTHSASALCLAHMLDPTRVSLCQAAMHMPTLLLPQRWVTISNPQILHGI